ncbi:hypothetical protein O6H91_18G003300 [Diphasiastrum complanatum]|uniref:Uncharacterized protein n=1 Tax=Diphasiastrum complanatum TaxID=34168 RepID=A0ACC2AXH7_DIPCM|nr:hypothetical protein O6H91_18G003300 [Diphasiastrum complanatum]
MGADHNSMKKNESDTSQSPSRGGSLALVSKPRRYGRLHALFKTIFSFISLSLIPCKRAALLSGPSEARSERRVLIGTLFGNRKGHVHFAVQEDPKTPPVLLLELATPTRFLVKEMKSGLVRIALECEKSRNLGKLIQEPFWTMYCNGRKTGYALRRTCSENDLRILSLLKAISMGAGVLPVDVDGSEGDSMFMRARFERVIGSKDSEAFYMMNPNGTGENSYPSTCSTFEYVNERLGVE